MLTSYNWLQTYFEKPLPTAEKLAELLTMRVFEVEGVERPPAGGGDDRILDIKVLPDRAHYCLSHRGIAGEVAALLGIECKTQKNITTIVSEKVSIPSISVEETIACPRYIGRIVENVSVGASPEWLMKRLIAIGQRPINNVVDAANFVMFDMGQPLHAFDADKVHGGITVRRGRNGEHIMTLDGKDITLTPDVLVIADDDGPLAIAGIKGGVRAQMDEKTTRIILEAANFAASGIRKTSTKLGIRTDASKRFENGITPEYASTAIEELTALIQNLTPGAEAGKCVDVYPAPQQKTNLQVAIAAIHKRLGIEVPRGEILQILSSLHIVVREEGEALYLSIPQERLDLTIPEDITEEVGRLYGYDKIEDRLPPSGTAPILDKRRYYMERTRDLLVDQGFSEVYLYSLVPEGEFEIELPLAEDKKALRTSLTPGLREALKKNSRNAPLLGLDQIKLFEFGSVFLRCGEVLALVVGIENASGFTKMKSEVEVKETVEKVLDALGAPREAMQHFQIIENIIEWSFDEFIKHLPEPSEAHIPNEENRNVRYRQFSPYPFISRDIALWTPSEESKVKGQRLKVVGDFHKITPDAVLGVLKMASGELLVTSRLFDEYHKGDKTSYAFRLVFQSPERTLTDEEVNTIMERIYAAVAEKGWEVR